MQVPKYTEEEALARETFLALMQGLSYPGRIFKLPVSEDDVFIAIAETLLDLETSYYTPDSSLADDLAKTGSRAFEQERASYHFYAQLDERALGTIKQASVGTMLYPDRSATLIIACKFGTGLPLILAGPGIKTETHIQVDGIDHNFWTLRQNATRYPLGWDIFLVDNNRVVGLPRTTLINYEERE